MATDWLGPAASVVSGALFILLGGALAFVRPRRASTVAFAAFAALWGALIVTGNGARLVADDAAARPLTLTFVAVFSVVYLPLLFFVDAFTGRRSWLTTTSAGVVALVAPAALGAVALLAAPDLLFEGFRGSGATRAAAWGPLFPLLDLLFFGGFILAVHRLHRSRRLAGSTIDAQRVTPVLAALALYVAYASAQTLVQYALRWPAAGTRPPLETIVFVGDSLVGLVVLARVAASLVREGRAGRRLAAWSIALPALLGLVSGVTRFTTLAPFPIETLGFLRVASVALIAYAILRYELFDIELKAKRGATVAAILVGAGLVALLVEQAIERVLGSTGIAITITQLALVGAVVAVGMKSPAAARALGERVLPGLHAPERLDARRLEVYEAALAQAATAPGGLAAQADFLADLRARLGVTEAEHQLLARLVAGAARGAPTAIETGALVGGRYRLERLLGEGAAGAAWLAADETLRRRVVVKALHARAKSDEAARAFLREARVMASLDHPNVARVFDFGQEGDVPFLVMEHVEGGSLEDRLAEGRPLAPREAESVLRDVLAGLAHVHARGVLHRDLKPGNVLLAQDGAAKISDFGVAHSADPNETQTGLAAPGPRGSPATMSPEAVRGLPPLPEGDVYSAGALLYRMLTGQSYLAFEGKTRAETHRAIVEDAPRPAPAGTDARLLRVALRALAKDPGERYASADEMRAALDAGVVLTQPDVALRA